MSNTLRVRFRRGENTKFVSHLDLMKSFDRAIRRAELPMGYSQGFNPHPSMVFGLPLSVGVSSEAEYVDIEITEDIDKDAFISRLNRSLPSGLECMSAEYFSGKGNIMKEIAYASYDMLVDTGDISLDRIKEGMEKLLDTNEIIVQKEGKNGPKDMDIKPLLIEAALGKPGGSERFTVKFAGASALLNTSGEYSIQYIQGVKKTSWNLGYNSDNVYLVSILCSAGSKANMKPELFIAALQKLLDTNMKIVKVHRTGLFIEKDGEISLPV